MEKMSTTERRAFHLSRLEDHRHLLKTAIIAMGTGDTRQALNIATSIRVLVYESGRSTPLLKRLRTGYLALTIRAGPSARAEASSPLAHRILFMSLPFAIRLQQVEPRVSLNPEPDMTDYRWSSLGDWWNKPAIKVPGCEPLSRKEVVLGVANKEGAHVDEEMSDNYRRVLESEPIRFLDGDTVLGPVNVTRFTVGQAGIEIVDMLDRAFPIPEIDVAHG